MDLSLPAKPKEKQPDVEVKNGHTFILTKDDRIFYYKGQFYTQGNDKGKPATQLTETNFSKDGLHKLLLEINDWAITEKKKIVAEGAAKKLADTTITSQVNEMMRNTLAPTVLIKTDDEATYKNAIDILLEAAFSFFISLSEAETKTLAVSSLINWA